MALNSLGLGFMFTAQDLASGVMDKIGDSLSGLEEKTGKSFGNIDKMVDKLGGGLTAAAIGVGGLATTFGLAGKAGEFEQALAAVGASTNATREQMEEMKKAAIEAAKGGVFTPVDALQAMNELAQAGYNITESIQLMKPAMNLAAGSNGLLGVAEAAGVVSQSLKGFSIDTSLAGFATDQLAQGAMAFSMNAGDLPLAIGTVTRGANLMNQSMTESMIAFGLVKNVMGGTEKSATAVSAAMARMIDTDTVKALKLKKIDVYDRQTGQIRKFLDVIKDMMPAMAKMGPKAAGWMKDVFGEDATGAINSIMLQLEKGVTLGDDFIKGDAAVGAYRTFFAKANGVNEEFARRSLDTFEGSMGKMTARWGTFAMKLGEPFKNAWRPIVDFATKGLEKFMSVFDDIDPETKNIMAATLMGSFAFLAMAGSILTLSALLPLLWAGIQLAAVALWQVATAALAAAWPFLLIAAVVGLVAYMISENIWGMGDAWDAVCEAFAAGGEWISETMSEIGEYFSQAWDIFSAGFVKQLGPAFSEFGSFMSEIGTMISDTFGVFGEVFGMAYDAVKPVLEALGLVGDTMEDAAGPGKGMTAVFSALGNVFGWVLKVLLFFIKAFVFLQTVILRVVGIVLKWLMPAFKFVFGFIQAWFEGLLIIIDKVLGAFRTVGGWFGFGEESTGPDGKPAGKKGPPKLAPPDGVADQTPGAAVAGQEAIMSVMPIQSEFDYSMLASALDKRPVKVDLKVNEETLASVMAKGNRSRNARQSGGDEYSEE